MGESKRKKSTTQKFIAKYPRCCFCGGLRAATTREHMPPKSLFDNSHRPDKLVMPACDDCNRGTSTADLIASSVARWNYDSDETEIRDHRALLERVRNRHPEIAEEWSKPIDRAKARSHLTRRGVQVPIDAGLVTIGPLTIRYLNLFAYKVALALYFERFQAPLTNEGRISGLWRSKEDFTHGVPSELLKMMHEYGTLEQGNWNASETFEYRYNENKKDGVFMCLSRFRKGLYTAGFATADATQLPSEELDWIRPADLLGMVDQPQFLKKL